MSLELLPAIAVAVAIAVSLLGLVMFRLARLGPASQQQSLESSLVRLEQSLRDELGVAVTP